ncbi:MAG: hypothetical protein ACMXYF_00535 [Candidatus Woesearchaeota archaeon]
MQKEQFAKIFVDTSSLVDLIKEDSQYVSEELLEHPYCVTPLIYNEFRPNKTRNLLIKARKHAKRAFPPFERQNFINSVTRDIRRKRQIYRQLEQSQYIPRAGTSDSLVIPQRLGLSQADWQLIRTAHSYAQVDGDVALLSHDFHLCLGSYAFAKRFGGGVDVFYGNLQSNRSLIFPEDKIAFRGPKLIDFPKRDEVKYVPNISFSRLESAPSR